MNFLGHILKCIVSLQHIKMTLKKNKKRDPRQPQIFKDETSSSESESEVMMKYNRQQIVIKLTI